MIPTTRRPPLSAVLLLGALLPLAGGCAFDRQWNRMAAQAQPEDAGGLAGRWVGTWHSERSNHKGGLRAIVTPVNEITYRARFDATYLGVLRFGYSMNLTARPDDLGGGTTRFTGEENLGWLAGGLYRYEGVADGQTFDCAYRSKNDHGRFQMTRPAAKGQAASSK